MTEAERIEGGLLGLLVGDALGVPYEFNPPSALPPRTQLDFVPPPGFRRSHGSVPPGTWSDDGAQALCLLASLLERGRLDVDDFARRLLDWYERGDMAVDGNAFDVGLQTSSALLSIRSGAPALDAGRTDERGNGNGSLMRALPLALWHEGTDAELVEAAHLQSRVTHPHPRSQVCCALYCLWARFELEGRADAWRKAVAVVRGHYPDGSEHRNELETYVRPDDAPQGSGSGYVVDCLRSARMVVEREPSYSGAVRAAIALGHDTDTTACVAGGIAGIRYGVGGIPAEWRSGLRGRELYEPWLRLLLVRRTG